MILVDTSIWTGHLRQRDQRLAEVLAMNVALVHPFVIGELACGSLPNHATLLVDLSLLPQALIAAHKEVLGFVERCELEGRGIGWIDVHLLASTMLAGRSQLWTRDKRLRAVAEELGVALPDQGVGGN